MTVPFAPSMAVIALAVGFSGLIGVVFGFFPRCAGPASIRSRPCATNRHQPSKAVPKCSRAWRDMRHGALGHAPAGTDDDGTGDLRIRIGLDMGGHAPGELLGRLAKGVAAEKHGAGRLRQRVHATLRPGRIEIEAGLFADLAPHVRRHVDATATKSWARTSLREIDPACVGVLDAILMASSASSAVTGTAWAKVCSADAARVLRQ